MLEKIEGIYAKAEEKFYDFVDFLADKGVPLNKLTDYLDEKGLPAFPTIVSVFVLLFLGIFLLMFSFNLNPKIYLTLTDEYGSDLHQVNVSIYDMEGHEIKSITASNNSTIELKDIPRGVKLKIIAEKEGYKKAEAFFYADEEVNAKLILESNIEIGTAKIKVVDSDGILISGAKIKIKKGTYEDIAYSDKFGFAEFEGAPLESPIYIEASAENYKKTQTEITLHKDEVYTLQMEALQSSYLEEDKGKLIVIVKNKEGEKIDKAEITAYNNQTDLIIDKKETENGKAVLTIGMGTEVRLLIKKEEYSDYDDRIKGTVFRMDKEEKQIERILEEGKYDLEVFVKTKDGKPIEDATIALYNLNKSKIDEKIGSQALFNNLFDRDYFIIAKAYGYLAKTKKINPKEKMTNIVLDVASTSNSTYLAIFVEDLDGKPVANAQIKIYEEAGEEILPYNTEDIYTDISGAATIRVEYNKKYKIEAKTEKSFGDEEIEVLPEQQAKVVVKMVDALDEISFEVRKNGDLIDGEFILYSNDGIELKRENFQNGKINVYAKKGQKIKIISEEDSYEMEIGDEKEYEIDIAKERTAKIRFLGAYFKGKKRELLTPDHDYVLKFEIENNGIGGAFIRIGDKENIEDEAFSIYCENCKKGKTYTNNEAFDRAKRTFRTAKWAEFEFDKGKRIINVYLKIKDWFEGKIPVYYRAWTIDKGEYIRDPFDSELKTKKDTEEKRGFYAEAYKTELNVLRKKGECNSEFCINYFFDDKEYKEDSDFWTTIGKTNKLVMEVMALKEGVFQQSVSGSKIDFMSKTPKTTNSGYIEKTDAETKKQSQTKFKKGEIKSFVYEFVANEEGQGEITVFSQMNRKIKKKLYFDIYEQKDFEIIMPNQIKPFEQVKIKLKADKEIKDALIKVYKKGKLVYSLKGNGGYQKGKNSEYLLRYSFGKGEYKISVEAKGFNKQEKYLFVSSVYVLEIVPEKAEYHLFRDSIKELQIVNNSDYALEKLSYEIKEINKANIGLRVLIPNKIESKQTAQAKLSIDLKDNKEETGVYDVIIRGNIGEAEVSAKTRIAIYKNKKINSACLRVNPDSLYISFWGGEQKQKKELTLTNYCNSDLKLRIKNSLDRQGFEIDKKEIEIKANETKNLEIEISSKVKTIDKERRFSGALILESEELSKEIGLNIEVVNSLYYLETPDLIELWPRYNRDTGKAFDSKRITLYNKSRYPASGLELSFINKVAPWISLYYHSGEEWETGDKANIGYIGPGQKIDNTYLQANYLGKKEMDKKGSLAVWGTINGAKRKIKEIKYSVQYSGENCLQITKKVDFYSENWGVTLNENIEVENKCKEDVLINQSEYYVGEHRIYLYPLRIKAGEKGVLRVNLQIGNENIKTEKEIKIFGVLANTQNPVISEMNIGIEIDKKEGVSKNNAKFREVKLKVCGKDDSKIIKVPVPDRDCTEGYCEAQDLAKLLGKEIALYKKNILNKISGKTGCDGFVCSLKELGIAEKKLIVYFKNDVLTGEELKKATGMELVISELLDKERNIINKETTGVIWNNLHYTSVLQGCGMYEITIDGGVMKEEEKFSNKPEKISLELKFKKIETAECDKSKIYNLPNFVIKGDKSRVYKDNLTKFVYSGSEAELKGAAEDLANKVFGTYERANKGQGAYKDIKIIEGGSGAYRLKIGVEDNQYKLNLQQGALDKSQKEKEISFAAKVVKQLINGAIGEKENCISEDEKYLGINRSANLYNIDILIKGNKETLYYGTEDAELKFSLKPQIDLEDVQVDIKVGSDQSTPKKYPTIEVYEKNKKGEYMLKNALSFTTKLEAGKEKEFKIVVKGEKEFFNKNDGYITIIAQKGKSKSDEEISLEKCGTNLGDFLEYVKKQMKKPEQEKTTFVSYLNWQKEVGNVEECLKNHGFYKGVNTEKIIKQKRNARAAAAGAYLVGCSASTLASYATFKKLFAAFATGGISLVADIALWGTLCVLPVIEPLTDFIDNLFFKGQGGWFKDIISAPGNWLISSNSFIAGVIRFITGVEHVKSEEIGESNLISPSEASILTTTTRTFLTTGQTITNSANEALKEGMGKIEAEKTAEVINNLAKWGELDIDTKVQTWKNLSSDTKEKILENFKIGDKTRSQLLSPNKEEIRQAITEINLKTSSEKIIQKIDELNSKGLGRNAANADDLKNKVKNIADQKISELGAKAKKLSKLQDEINLFNRQVTVDKKTYLETYNKILKEAQEAGINIGELEEIGLKPKPDKLTNNLNKINNKINTASSNITEEITKWNRVKNTMAKIEVKVSEKEVKQMIKEASRWEQLKRQFWQEGASVPKNLGRIFLHGLKLAGVGAVQATGLMLTNWLSANIYDWTLTDQVKNSICVTQDEINITQGQSYMIQRTCLNKDNSEACKNLSMCTYTVKISQYLNNPPIENGTVDVYSNMKRCNATTMCD